MRVIFCNLLLTILLVASSIASHEKSRYSIEFGLFGEVHLHSANFKALPNIDNCCPQFKSAFGLGFSPELGLNYSLNKIFDRNSLLGLRIGYSYSEPQFSEEEFIGNVIFNDTYTQGISEHIIHTKISRINIKPYFAIEPLPNLPLNAFLGFGIGFTSQIHINQEEKLKSPAGATYENRSTIRNQFSGNLEDLSNPNFSLFLGANYNGWKLGKFKIKPELNINIGVSNLVKSINWKANSINLGILIEYNFPKPVSAPPRPAPLPEIPKPEPPEVIALDFDLYSNNKLIKPEDTIFVIQTEIITLAENIYPAIFFYDYNQTNYRQNPHIDEDYVFKTLATRLKNNDLIKIIIGYTENEDTNIIELRKNIILKKLADYNIPQNKIELSTYFTKASNLKYKELADESRFIKFVFPDNSNFIKVQDTISKRTELDPNIINIKTAVQSNYSYEITGKFFLGENLLTEFNSKDYKFSLNDLLFVKNLLNLFDKIKISETLSSNNNLTISQEKTYNLKVIKKTKTEQKLNENKQENTKYEEITLGFFEFDKDEFYIVDTTAINKVKTAIANNKEVEIIPLHDYFGEKDYNQKLVRQRLNSALKLLGIASDKIKVNYPKSFLFPNEQPETRILNRSVIIRIYHQ